MYTVADTIRLRLIACAIAMILGPMQGVSAKDTSDAARTPTIIGAGTGLPLKKAGPASGAVLNGIRTQPPAIPQSSLKKTENKKKPAGDKAAGAKGAAGKKPQQPVLRAATAAKPPKPAGQAAAEKNPAPRINTTTDEKTDTTPGSINTPARIPTFGSSPGGSAIFRPGTQGLAKLPGERSPVPGAGVDTRLDAMRDKLEGGRMRGQMERAGIGRDLQRGSQFNDPLTGDPLMTGQRRYSGYDPALGGRGGNDPLGSGRASAFSDPLTGRSRLGGGATGAESDSKADQVRAAGRLGKGMAMDDDTVTDDTPVFMDMTFSEAYLVGLGQKDGMTVTMDSGTQITIWSTRSHSTGSEAVVIEYNYSDGRKSTVAWVKGEEMDVWDRPRPDDDGSGPAPTEAERRQLAEQLKNWSDPSARPHPDDDGAPKGGGNVEEALDDVDLAGRPRPDQDRERRSGTPDGTVFTQLGLAGQPVDQDPDFGTLPLGGGGVGSGGFGAALVQDLNTGLKVPLNDAANRVGSRVDAQLEQME